MIKNGRNIRNGSKLEYDLCIIGSGPAGITLALEMESSTRRICILEAGGEKESVKETKEFFKGENAGLPYDIERSRSRCFGGTSNRWAGYCAMLDPDDMKKKEWVPNSGWPVSYDELHPYYKRAHDIIGLSTFEYNPQKWAGKDHELLQFKGGLIGHKIWYFKNLRFAERFRGILEESGKIDIFLNSTVTKINKQENSKEVRSVTINTAEDITFNVKADHYVLACGGMENARVLLSQNIFRKGTFSNENIGRYFIDHPHYFNSMDILLFGKRSNSFLYRKGRVMNGDDYRVRPFFQIAPNIRDRMHFPNMVFKIIRSIKPEKSYLKILEMLKKLYKPGEKNHRVSNVVIMAEQYPNYSSRITLTGKKDKYGIPFLRLDWRLTEKEVRKTFNSAEFLGMQLGENELGRLRARLFFNKGKLKRVGYGSHHLGTTRMSETPDNGVVDSNCTMFGTRNLSIAGSSVFPTGGCSNPTLTILAMTIRLADHLKKTI